MVKQDVSIFSSYFIMSDISLFDRETKNVFKNAFIQDRLNRIMLFIKTFKKKTL